MTPQSLALTVEQILLHPRYAELAAAMRAHTPVGQRDQLDAAATEAHYVVASYAADEDIAPANMSAAQVAGWIRLGLLDTLAAFCTGMATTCVHNPDPSRPEPLHAAAWKPGLVVCVRCTHLLQLPKGTPADRTCDACGHVCAGLAAGDGIFPSTARLGPMLYHFGACRGCTADAGLPTLPPLASPTNPEGTS